MRATLSVSNYRCFGHEPVTFDLPDGFVAYLGKNNAGKSCLFRLLYEIRSLLKPLDEAHLVSYLARTSNPVFNLQHLLHNTEIFSQQTNGNIEILLKLSGDEITSCVDLLRIEISRPSFGRSKSTENNSLTVAFGCTGYHIAESKPPAVNRKGALQSQKYLRNDSTHINADCGPILKLCNDISNAAYFSSFRSLSGNYQQTNGDSFDMTIGTGFITKWKNERGSPRSEIRKQAVRAETDIGKLFGYDDFRLEPGHDNKTLLATINGYSHPIEALGAGISEGIMMIANAAIQQPSWILVDEPELHLHAALQDKLLQVLAEYCTRGVMFTTHNVGLAYHVASSKYVVTQNAHGISSVREWESSRSLIETVAAMSFSSWKEVGYDQILLVEGSTEVPLFQNLLTLYGKGSHVFVWSLGGSSTIRSSDLEQLLTEFKRLGSKVSAIIDSERTDAGTIPSERRHFATKCEQADIHCHLTEKRATENYLTASALSAALDRETAPLSDYEDFKTHPNKWPKNSNFRIGRLMSKEDWDATDIGRFLQAL